MCLSLPATAQEAGVTLPAGATLLNISATERIEVAQDQLVANIRIEKTMADSRELQQDINRLIKQALEIVKDFKTVEVSTDQYYVYEYNTKTQNLWRGTQGLTLKGKDADDILEVSGKLQDLGFLMNGLGYQLSSEKYEEVRDGLLELSLKKLMARAKRVGITIDKPDVDLWEVNVDAAPSPIYPQPVMMRTMMADSGMAEKSFAAPPVAEAGKNEISMTVSAKVLLK
ncbi:MAG: SIMPL domain-containing protein [Rhodospirillales bacterium]|nr:SIMPL domain-containing protein [Rhodospirillales bacterium]MCB9973958.1 SIMPL domain-containing protein [Rhodospirillales bacterium]